MEDKFNSLYRALRRNIKLRARISSLTNAYLLRKFLNDIETPALQSWYKQKLTSHYTTIVTYTFDLFEYLPAHIYVTKFLTVQIIRKIKRTTILELRDKILGHFARAPNLEGEDCWRHSTAPTAPEFYIYFIFHIYFIFCIFRMLYYLFLLSIFYLLYIFSWLSIF